MALSDFKISCKPSIPKKLKSLENQVKRGLCNKSCLGGNMHIGAKQILLLKMCKDKGHLTVRDVRDVYGLPSGRTLEESNRQSRIAKLKLKLLETYGYIKRQNNKHILTKLGEKSLQEWEKKHK